MSTSHVFVPNCTQQQAVVSRVGRGLRGDSFAVELIEHGNGSQTTLVGKSYSERDKIWETEWTSENINGGKLSYMYALNPNSEPPTFTITFIYERPGQESWSWTTPAIPYLASETGEEYKSVFIKALFARADENSDWVDYTVYPEGDTTPVPNPGDPWTTTLTFGAKGNLEVPNLGDLAAVLGVTKQELLSTIEGNAETPSVDDKISSAMTTAQEGAIRHIHDDLGFFAQEDLDNNPLAHNFDGYDTLSEYLDSERDALKTYTDAEVMKLDNRLSNVAITVTTTEPPATGGIPNSICIYYEA